MKTNIRKNTMKRIFVVITLFVILALAFAAAPRLATAQTEPTSTPYSASCPWGGPVPTTVQQPNLYCNFMITATAFFAERPYHIYLPMAVR